MNTPSAGNHCGHCPSAPRFFTASNTSRPDVLKIAQKAAKDFYNAPDQFLQSLRHANGTESQQRTERRECISAALQVMLEYTDLDTLQVGTPIQGEIAGIQLGFIAKKLGFHVKRVYRGIKDLATAGYIKIQWCRRKKFGKFITVRQIDIYQRCFKDLGISSVKLQTSRHYKRKSLQKSAQRVDSHQNDSMLPAKAKIAKLRDVLTQALQSNAKKSKALVNKKTADIDHAAQKEAQKRHKYVNDRLDYFENLRKKGLSFEAAKEKTDSAYPPLS